MTRGWGSAALALAVGVGGGAAAWKGGGARDARAMPPHVATDDRAEASPKPAVRSPAGAEAEEVVIRLIDALKDARIEVPSLRAGTAALEPHWRKMRAPWTGLGGTAAKLAMSYAHLTSEEELEYQVPLANGDVWKPDARQWNMAEGSFDQRDAVFAPTPAQIAYRVSMPLRAALDFSISADNAPGEVVFAVRVKDAKGETRELWTRPLARRDTKKWIDARVDLSAYGGQSVELQLVTSARNPSTHEAASGVPGLALWGNPVILAREPTRVPYNVLWIVVDATRADAIPSFHDDAEDARKRAAPLPPLEALLPKVPGLTPALDELGKRGVRFTHAYSAASWTRPGTVAMLSGARSTEVGLDPIHWQLPDVEATRFYASSPPLLPLLLRRQGVVTRAFVNNYFMVGYAAVGVDMGFEAIADYRYRTRDTGEITSHTVEWLKAHKDERFFVFCNYNSPHEPLDPPQRFQARVPPPPAGPSDPESAKYMAEVAKDDEAIGVLLRTLDETGLRGRTLVVMTADHGETLSSAHGGTSALDHMRVRYHHSASNFEETTHVPIILSLPGKLPEDSTVVERARTIDIAPTVLDIEGLEKAQRMTGRSLSALANHAPDGEPRVVLSEGRGTHGLLVGDYRLLTREGKAETVIFAGKEVSMPLELFDLTRDPGERRNLLRAEPEKAAEMKARLEAAINGVPAGGDGAGVASLDASGAVQLRFAGGGGVHRVAGSLWVDAGSALDVKPIGLPGDAVRGASPTVEVAFLTTAEAPVGFDVVVIPPDAPLHWDLFVDDRRLAPSEVYGGPFGVPAPALEHGVVSDDARATAFAARPPLVDPRRDLGLFVARTRRALEADVVTRGHVGGAGTDEMKRLMREWGYAHDAPEPSRQRGSH